MNFPELNQVDLLIFLPKGCLCLSGCLLFVFEMSFTTQTCLPGSLCGVQHGLELLMFLPQLPRCWDYSVCHFIQLGGCVDVDWWNCWNLLVNMEVGWSRQRFSMALSSFFKFAFELYTRHRQRAIKWLFLQDLLSRPMPIGSHPSRVAIET